MLLRILNNLNKKNSRGISTLTKPITWSQGSINKYALISPKNKLSPPQEFAHAWPRESLFGSSVNILFSRPTTPTSVLPHTKQQISNEPSTDKINIRALKSISLDARKAILIDLALRWFSISGFESINIKKIECVEKYIVELINAKNQFDIMTAFDALEKRFTQLKLEYPDERFNPYYAGKEMYLFLVYDLDWPSIVKEICYHYTSEYLATLPKFTVKDILAAENEYVVILKNSILLIIEELNTNDTWLPVRSQIYFDDKPFIESIKAAGSRVDILKAIVNSPLMQIFHSRHFEFDLEKIYQEKLSIDSFKPIGTLGLAVFKMLKDKEQDRITFHFPEEYIKLQADLERWQIICLKHGYDDDERCGHSRYAQDRFGSLNPSDEKIREVVIKDLTETVKSGRYVEEIQGLLERHDKRKEFYLSDDARKYYRDALDEIKADIEKNYGITVQAPRLRRL